MKRRSPDKALNNFSLVMTPKIFLVSGGFVLEKLGQSVGNKFFWQNYFATLCSKYMYLTSYVGLKPDCPFALETNTFGAGERNICRRGKACSAPEANAFGTGDELV